MMTGEGRSGRRFDTEICIYAVTSPSRICRGCSTRSSEGGFSMTGFLVGGLSPRRCDNWIDHWPAGLTGNTRSCTAICAGRRIRSRVSRDAIRSCGRTGRWECGVVPWRETYELRGSSTVLRGSPFTGDQLYGMRLHQLMGTVKYPAQATPRRSSVSRSPENGTHGLKGEIRNGLV